MLSNRHPRRPGAIRSGASAIFLATSLAVHAGGSEEPLSSEAVEFFETKIRPLLAEACYSCHSKKAEKLKAGLHLDSRAGVLQGGDTGPAIVPGKPDESLLIRAVRYTEESLEMPPKRKLTPAQISDLERWVAAGAPWPGDTGEQITKSGPAFDFDKFRREHWSFRPVKKPKPPSVDNEAWIRNPIDRFILAKQEDAGLSPEPEADRRILIRRAYLDLTGLPPSPEQVEAFILATEDDPFSSLVNTLLESKHYGERWGRHWLDVARYSDGLGGFLDNRDLPNAWKYRDWVVRKFNEDLPYDEFVRQQIAGDLYDGNFEAHIGSGFFAVGPTYRGDGGDAEATAQAKAETLSDRVDTFSRAFLGLTAACARCHDHKFDPITMSDYYAIAGIFNNSNITDVPLAPKEEIEKYQAAQKAFKDHEKRVNDFRKNEAKRLEVKPNEFEAKLEAEKQADWEQMKTELERLKIAVPPAPPTAHALRDTGSGDMHIAIRGDLRKKGAVAPRRFVRVLAGEDSPAFTSGSGRRQLAEAVVDPANPLTARVMVNRIWLHHFGKALVRSPSNFGILGEKPTHPELLDWLAAEFVESGWSMKHMHRLIMTSATWRMASSFDQEKFGVDGDNRLVWRTNPRKLDVEAWRDSLLAVTGELDKTLGGAPTDKILESKRRTLYAKISRNGDRFESDEWLRLFDFPAPRSTSAERTPSTVPQQYLFMLNSEFMVQRARALAEKLSTARPTNSGRITLAYEALYARPPTPSEIDVGEKFLAMDGSSWDRYAQALLSSHEFMQIQ